jgi:Na+/citrate or Na+/malate symporter
VIQQSEKTPPEITEEEEIVPKQKKEPLKDKKAEFPLDFQKFSLGSTTLGWCIFLMFLCIVLSIWKPDNELVKSGFEAFKLIVMTILGYIFGSNTSRKE